MRVKTITGGCLKFSCCKSCGNSNCLESCLWFNFLPVTMERCLTLERRHLSQGPSTD